MVKYLTGTSLLKDGKAGNTNNINHDLNELISVDHLTPSSGEK
jgi:hypothetical protein